MDVWGNVLFGFQQVLQPNNLFLCLIGVLLGTLVGVLPGIGPVTTISLMLGLIGKTMGSNSLGTLIMLAGVYYGAMYGGSTTSILVNIPGEVASIVTCLDGYQMSRKGRAGPALGISALGSFFGGTFSIILLMLLVVPLSRAALFFGPPEYFALITMGMVMVNYLIGHSFLKGTIMIIVGLILSCVGTDLISGKARFVYGVFNFSEGINIVPVGLGLFGISEILLNIEEGLKKREIFEKRVKNLLPSLQDWKRSIFPMARGSILGFFLGLLPGAGPVLASFFSYTLEKKISKHPEEFGKGAIEGVAGPESANNAAVGGNFIPLFALGIPANVVMALIFSAFATYGIEIGPRFLERSPDIFWGIICSMYLGNIMLLVINLPLIGIWIKILEIPYKILFPLILLLCVIGSYSCQNDSFDILMLIIFGLIGYFLRKFDYELAPLVLAFVLGPIFENSFRQTMIIGGNSFFFFFHKPVVVIGFSIIFFLIISSFFKSFMKFRKKVADSVQED